jgi:cystathionine beta-synthase
MCVAVEVAKELSEKDFVVVFIPDTGTRNLSKIYNDEWMRENQYFESEVDLTAAEIVGRKPKSKPLLTASPKDTVHAAMQKMMKEDISQLPVFEDGQPIGALYEDDVVRRLMEGKDIRELVVREVMGKPFPVVAKTATFDQITAIIPAQATAVLVELGAKKFDVITKYDLVHSLAEGAK